mmetsp:Transcript_19578/g.58362  ORF Transcript_19578/g.58362 Transcript_19578/m.58362 type:complete len:491 (-) Transcript_19578:39-1511(-)
MNRVHPISTRMQSSRDEHVVEVDGKAEVPPQPTAPTAPGQSVGAPLSTTTPTASIDPFEPVGMDGCGDTGTSICDRRTSQAAAMQSSSVDGHVSELPPLKGTVPMPCTAKHTQEESSRCRGSSATWSITTTANERRKNWDGVMLSLSEFVARYGERDGRGLFMHAAGQGGVAMHSSPAVRKLPSHVANDLAHFLRHSSSAGRLTPSQTKTAQRSLASLSSQGLLDTNLLRTPSFKERVKKNVSDFAKGRKTMTRGRRHRAEAWQSTWRVKLHRFLTDWRVEVALTVLLVLDIIFVIVSINLEIAALDAEVKDCESYAERVHKQCSALDTNCHSSHRFARSSTSTCSCSAEETFGNHAIEEAETGVRWTSVGILSVFVIEGLLHWLEMGLRFFTENHGMHAFDLLVVAIALTFEAHKFGNWSGAFVLLIIGRLWRFIQFWHSMKHAETAPAVDLSLHVLEDLPDILVSAVQGELDDAKESAGKSCGKMSAV